MLNGMWYLRDRLSSLRDQRGIETLEWILIGAIVTGVAGATYNLLFPNGLDPVVTDITNYISNSVPITTT